MDHKYINYFTEWPVIKSPEGVKVAKIAIDMEIELDDSWSSRVSIDSAWQAEQIISLQQSSIFNHMDVEGVEFTLLHSIWKI